MLVYIDESGDAGLKKIGQGSSPFFVLAMVVFAQEREAERVAERVQALRESLKLRKEFSFNGLNRVRRERFLHAITSRRFHIHSLIIDKARLTDPMMQVGKRDVFYRYICRTFLDRYRHVLTGAKVRIDGEGEQAFRKHFRSAVQGNVALESLALRKSHADDLMQMADMVVGAIHRSYHATTKTDRHVYRAIIAPRIVDEWVLPS